MRKLAWFAGGFGIACLLSCYIVGGIIPAALCVVLCALSLALRCFARPGKHESPRVIHLPKPRKFLLKGARCGTALFLGGALAFLWFTAYTALFLAPAEELAGTEQTISGTVTTYPEETSIGGYSMVIRLDGGFRSPDVLLYGNGDWGSLTPGDRVTCNARLKASDTLYGDETTYYTARGLFLLGYCDDPPISEKADTAPFGLWPALCAKALRDGIYAAFDHTAAPLAAAVTLGDKSGLSEQTYSALSRSGIMHAAVVSGMHISFLSSLLLILCGWQRKAAVLLVPLLFFYALMAGGTPSAIRAVIMQTALLAGPLLNRENDGPTSMGLALMILLIQNPCAAASVSLQLSFASVAGIMLIGGKLTEALLTPVRLRLRDGSTFWRAVLRVYRFIVASVAVSLGAMLFTVPLITLYFGQIPLVSPLSNILTLWAVTALMVCALVIGTLGIFLPAVSALPGLIAGLLAHYIDRVTSLIGRLSMSSLDGGNPYFLVCLVTAYLLLLTVALARQKARQAVLSLGILSVLLAAAVGFNALTIKRADLTVTALDVGQGASTLIQSGNQAVLVDCGGSAADSAGDLAANRLAAAGRTKLDALILTHLDDDHFNGVSQLFWRLDVAQVFLIETTTKPENLALLLELARAEGAQVSFVTEARKLPLGSADLTLYPPLSGGTSNGEGLFVLCSLNEFDVLITGDAGSLVEKMVVKYYPIPDLELLMVGHHGSKYSTCEEFLNALRPELAVISVGYNSYGHPTDEVLDRLSAAGSTVYRTDEMGTVTIRVRDGAVSIR